MAKDRLKVELDYDVDSKPIDKVNESLEGNFSLIKKNEMAFVGLGAVGAAGLYAISSAVSESLMEFGNFEDTMLQVRAITGATEEEYEMLSDKARELGASTRYTAEEMAQAQKYFGMAGYSVEQINDALAPTINLAAATGEEVGLLADIVSDSMSAFGLGADETTRFTDVLAATATSTNTSVGALGEAFKYAAPAAKAMGMSIEETSRMLGIMANNGIKGSMAGTTLRTALLKLNEVPTGTLSELGIDMAEFQEMSSPEKIEALGVAFKDLDGTQQAAYAKTIFGQEAMTGMMTIINATEKETAKLDGALENYTGIAQEMADINNSGLKASMDGLNSAVSDLKIELGEQLAPVFQPLIELVTFFTRATSKFLDVTGAATPILTTVAGALVGLMIPALYMAATATWAWVAPILAVAAPFIAIGAAIGLVIGLIAKLMEKFDLFSKIGDKFKSFFGGGETDINVNENTSSIEVPQHRTGLSNVPYDGYTAQLHEGERVLTKSENREYSQGGTSGNVTVNVNMQGGSNIETLKRMIESTVRKWQTDYEKEQLDKIGWSGA